MSSNVPEGLTANYTGHSPAYNIVLIVSFTVALYNAIELPILIFVTFRRFNGLYFWSLLLSDVLGVIPHTVGYILDFFSKGPPALGVTISTIGWYFMVPGQSIVLYSRLHLVLQNRKLLRYILWIIIIMSASVVIPTTVVDYGSVLTKSPHFTQAYQVIERLQLTWFSTQEFMLNGIYIVETIKLLKISPEKNTGRELIMYELIIINVVMVLMDVALLVLEYLDLFILQVTLKSAIYSIKLKLEFAVLSRLIVLVHPPQFRQPSPHEEDRFPTFVDPNQITRDYTHASPPPADRRFHSPWAITSSSDEAVSSRATARPEASARSSVSQVSQVSQTPNHQ